MRGRPNIVLIVTDQHRADHLGCYGNPVVRTPNIDSIAADGTRFERFYVASPVCMPNRASLMTGRMPSLHGVRHNGIDLSAEHVTFVELLAAAGYRTGLIGKSHLQNFTGAPPTRDFPEIEGLEAPPADLREADRRHRQGAFYDIENQTLWDDPEHGVSLPFYGFQHARICTGHGDLVGADYLRWLKEKGGDADALVGEGNALPDQRRVGPQVWRTAVPEELYPTRYVEELSIEFLEQAAGTGDPFFAQISFPDPHHPFTPPGRYWEMYDPDEIDLPSSFGKGDLRALQYLWQAREAGTAVRTSATVPFAVSEEEARVLIALTYGMITMVDDAVGNILSTLDRLNIADDTVVMFTSDHGDFMGDHGIMLKYLLHYQGLIRVPFVCRVPGQAGDVRAGLGQTIDIGATALGLAGLQPFNGMQGRDLLSTEAPKELLVEEDSIIRMFGDDPGDRVRTLVTDRWRLSCHQEAGWWELYDLENDPDEIENLWGSDDYRDIADDLMQKLIVKMIDLQDRSPLPSGRA